MDEIYAYGIRNTWKFAFDNETGRLWGADVGQGAFEEVNIELKWMGSGLHERGIDVKTGRVLVEVDPNYFRPADVEQLLGDPSKARNTLGWNPRRTSFTELVKIMARYDLEQVKLLQR